MLACVLAEPSPDGVALSGPWVDVESGACAMLPRSTQRPGGHAEKNDQDIHVLFRT